MIMMCAQACIHVRTFIVQECATCKFKLKFARTGSLTQVWNFKLEVLEDS